MSEPTSQPLIPPTLPAAAGQPAASTVEARGAGQPAAAGTLVRRLRDGGEHGTAWRLGALAGAGALLGLGALRRRSPPVAAGAAALAVPLLWRAAFDRWPLPAAWTASSVVVKTRLVIWRPRREVYAAWRALERLPAYLRHLESVEPRDERRSRWVARVPGGARVEWEAEITEDLPGEALAWRSVEESPVQQLGSLVFDPWRGASGRDDATLLRADLRLVPGAGAAGRAVAALLRPVLAREIHEDLRRFKSVLEAGEVPTTAGQPSGRRGAVDVENPS